MLRNSRSFVPDGQNAPKWTFKERVQYHLFAVAMVAIAALITVGSVVLDVISWFQIKLGLVKPLNRTER